MELLADKQLLEDVKKLVNNNNEDNIGNKVQTGGYVFDLIPRMAGAFMAAVEFIGKFFIKAFPILFKFNIFKVGRTKEGKEYAYVSPHLKTNEGQFWRYIKVCLKASLFLCIFALGGVIVTVFGIVYLYTRLFKHFNKLNKKGDFSDEAPKKKED